MPNPTDITTGGPSQGPTYYTIRNWRRFQHYKHRNPPWIKLHVEILSSEDFTVLADASKLLALVCMVIAARNNGLVPAIPAYIKRVAYLDKLPNLKPLIESGFLIETLADASMTLADASASKQLRTNACTETETETEREEEKKDKKVSIRAKPSVQHQTEFDEFWKVYPKRKGSNPKVPAKAKFDAAVKNGTAASTIIDAARRYAEDDRGNVGTPYIAQAMVWLNQHRWEDYPSRQPLMSNGALQPVGVFVKEGTPGWEAWQKHLKKTTGRGSPCVNFGWTFPTLLPPEITHQESFTEETPI